MKKKLIIAAIYLSGCACSYVIIKNKIMQLDNKYTVIHRICNLGVSTGSWLTVTACGIFELGSKIDLNTPANW